MNKKLWNILKIDLKAISQVEEDKYKIAKDILEEFKQAEIDYKPYTITYNDWLDSRIAE